MVTPSPIPLLRARDIRRFWAKVNKSGTCWLWTSRTDREGYGEFRIGRKYYRAPRVAFVIQNGPLPDDYLVRHDCDTPGCVRGEHLLSGTPLQNNQDRASRGRHAPHRKRTPAEKQEIRRRGKLGQSAYSIALALGVSRRSVRYHLAKAGQL